MRREIATEIVIEAPAERVWQILTDFARFREWNPFLLKVRGRAAVGAWVAFVFEMPRGFFGAVCARIVTCDANKELRWVGRVPGLFRAEHYFVIERVDDARVRFRHGEILSGLLLPPAWRLLLERGGPPVYEAMNIALKRRAEA